MVGHKRLDSVIRVPRSPRTGDREQTTDSHFTFVAVNDEGTLIEVPDLTVRTERCNRLREAALAGATIR